MKKERRFEVIFEEGKLNDKSRIIRDKKTGVQYLYAFYGQGAGLTVLVDKDGKPLIDD